MVSFIGCSGEWSSYPGQSLDKEKNAKDLIGPGDTLDAAIFGEPDLSGEYIVLSDGTIQMPLVGIITIEALSLEEAGEKISKTYQKKGYLVDPKVSLSIAQSKTLRILGEVQNAGEYTYKQGATVLALVANAGGFSYRANQNRFDIVRKNADGTEKVIQAVLSTRLQPGDIVRVKERYF